MPESRRDVLTLAMLALCLVAVHVATNGQYGFHRDELQILDDARHLDWGFVTYPPLTPFIERVSYALFGPSLVGLRLFSAIGQGVVLILTGLMARELGGGRTAQIVAALAVAIAPIALFSGTEFQYTSFDYLWWVAIAWCTIRALKSEEPRWLAIGALIGVALLTKYAVVFFVAGLVGGLLLTPARKAFATAALWYGVGLALLIFLPNLVWEIQHHFITLDFLHSIHLRDVHQGRSASFLFDQFTMCTSLWTFPLWNAGLVYLFVGTDMKRFRPIAWMFLIPFLLLMLANGRGYYLGPAYPMLFAAGAVLEERWIATLRPRVGYLVMAVTVVALAIGGFTIGRIVLPILPVDDPNNWAIRYNGDLHEEIGWQELVGTVARIRDGLPIEERAKTGILAGNYGEAGAVDLYGPDYGLPPVICGTNTYWLRGYPDPPPDTLIVVGCSRRYLESHFASVELAGHNINRYRLENEECRDHPDIFLCRKLRQPWPDFWKDFQSYG